MEGEEVPYYKDYAVKQNARKMKRWNFFVTGKRHSRCDCCFCRCCNFPWIRLVRQVFKFFHSNTIHPETFPIYFSPHSVTTTILSPALVPFTWHSFKQVCFEEQRRWQSRQKCWGKNCNKNYSCAVRNALTLILYRGEHSFCIHTQQIFSLCF